jgi:hypothetical protein
MKSLAFALVLLATLPMHAAPASAADFPLTAHVVYSMNTTVGLNGEQRLDATIDGQPVKLACLATVGVLKLGDYPARISPKITPRKSWKSYDQYTGYDLLLPDGKVRTYFVVGTGTPIFAATQ